MKSCSRCVLDENFPGISFNEEGLCNFCRHHTGADARGSLEQKYEKRFAELVRTHKGQSSYDCLIAYSGGKDSTYTLHLLKNKYDLRVLALTYDNWFQSERAAANIRNVIKFLNIDHLTVRPRFDSFRLIMRTVMTKDIYPMEAMKRASSVCTTCISLIRFACLKTAIEKDIPFVVFGMSPGQAPMGTSVVKTNPEMTRKTQDVIFRPLYESLGEVIRPYFLEEKDFAKAQSFPYSVNPLRFSVYEESLVLQVAHDLGWTEPDDTGSTSTNCLLNSLANVMHVKRYGFHPYALELATLVREGYLERSVALERISCAEDGEAVERVRERLEKE